MSESSFKINNMRYLLFLLLLPYVVFSQTEQNDLITYDTTLSIPVSGNSFAAPNLWEVRITRPANGDTASRPAFIFMPGEGQQGNSDTSNLTAYGPHYWLKNGWNGSVQLANGTHYPILITICYVNQVYNNVPDFYNVVNTLLTYYHIKRNAVHFTGLSEGAFTCGSLVAYEATPGAQTGMKIMTSCMPFEGTPNPSLTQPNNTLGADTPLYKTWATQYHGKYFYLEGNGSDNFRDGYQYSQPMNNAVPGSAYFSYESDGGGAHCCWNDFYNPSVTNWTCVGTMGTYNASSSINTMGTYKASENVFQWMLRQGDTTLVTASAPLAPPVAIISNMVDSVTLPSDSLTLIGGNSTDVGGKITSYTWTQTVGPIQAVIAPNGSSATISHMAQGSYIFQLTVKDNNGNSSSALAYVTERFMPVIQRIPVGFSLALLNGVLTTVVTFKDGSTSPIMP
jgi:hypothetical protein